MSGALSIFHSTEIDEDTGVAVGWYVGECDTAGDMIFDDGCAGPYATEAQARDAMTSGAWIEFAPAGVQHRVFLDRDDEEHEDDSAAHARAFGIYSDPTISL